MFNSFQSENILFYLLSVSISSKNIKMVVDVVVLPGNGGGGIEDGNWYGWLGKKVKEVSCF